MEFDYPLGAVISFAGNSEPAQGWILCDGRSLARSSYQPLFDAIGTSNGGDGNNFNVPDYRGRFLRGRDGGAGRDPDAGNRTAASAGGAAGDKVGSLQECATAIPRAGFNSSIPRLPTGGQDVAATAVGYTLAKWKDGSRNLTLAYTGGDAETRPANIALRYYIFAGL